MTLFQHCEFRFESASASAASAAHSAASVAVSAADSAASVASAAVSASIMLPPLASLLVDPDALRQPTHNHKQMMITEVVIIA